MRISKRSMHLVAALLFLLWSNNALGGNFKHINIGFCIYGVSNDTPDAKVNWWAHHVDLAVLSTPIPEMRGIYSKIRTFNPDIKVLMYQQSMDTGWARYGDSDLKTYAGKDYENTFLHVGGDCRYDPGDGMLKAKAGDRVHTFAKDRDMKNIKNETYRNWWGDFASKEMTALKTDGVMADNWEVLHYKELPLDKYREYPCPGVYHTKTDVENAWNNDFLGMAPVIKKKIGGKWLIPNVNDSAKYLKYWKDVLTDGALMEYWGDITGGTDKVTGMDKFQSDLDAGQYAVKNHKKLILMMYSLKGEFPEDFAARNKEKEGMSREQIFFLSEYYMIKGDGIYFDYQSSKDPETSWFKALEADVGSPVGEYSVLETGKDPSYAEDNYKIFGRKYTNALVLVKPRPSQVASYGADSKTTYKLDGMYSILRADGSVERGVNSVTLRNAEGVILLKKGRN